MSNFRLKRAVRKQQIRDFVTETTIFGEVKDVA